MQYSSTSISRAIKTLVVCLSLVFVATTYAATKKTDPSKQKAYQLAAADDSTSAKSSSDDNANQLKSPADSKLVAQRFLLHGAAQLNVEFRYVEGKLKYLYFWNTDKPIDVDVFSEEFVLGENDDLQIRAPSVEQIILHVGPHDPRASTRLSFLKLGKTFVFTKSDSGFYQIHRELPNL